MNGQKSTLSRFLNQPYHENSARNSPTAGALLTRHSQVTHPVVKWEPLELCQKVQAGVRGFQPTTENGGEYLVISI